VSDEIRLVVPAQEDFRHITHLVVGGLGARLDLTYEDLDDLQTALDALLGCRDDDGEIEVVVDASDTAIRSTVGPFEEAQLDELETESAALGLRRVLETVVDGFEVERRDGHSWVVLTKKTTMPAETSG
jgi:anti-sigma regulatory factor (Ser/Thr protein kinase)